MTYLRYNTRARAGYFTDAHTLPSSTSAMFVRAREHVRAWRMWQLASAIVEGFSR